MCDEGGEKEGARGDVMNVLPQEERAYNVELGHKIRQAIRPYKVQIYTYHACCEFSGSFPF